MTEQPEESREIKHTKETERRFQDSESSKKYTKESMVDKKKENLKQEIEARKKIKEQKYVLANKQGSQNVRQYKTTTGREKKTEGVGKGRKVKEERGEEVRERT